MRKNILKINFLKFKGKEVAVVNGKIIASGNSSKKVFGLAKKRFPCLPNKDITLLSVPKEKAFVYILFYRNFNKINSDKTRFCAKRGRLRRPSEAHILLN